MGGGELPKISYGDTENPVGGDSFLLCSDGLWGYFSDAELAGVVAAFPAREAAETLLNRARSRANGEGDNVSVAILKLIEVPAKKS
jgi:serine/threonine protein phosphatase PrpC